MQQKLLTAQLKEADRRAKLRSLALTAPLVLFLLITFAAPIAAMLVRSVYNPEVADIFPRLSAALAKAAPTGVPDEAVFAALAEDMKEAAGNRTIGRAATRLNQERSGMRTLVTQTARHVATATGPYKEKFIALDARWGDAATWSTFRLVSQRVTATHYLAAADLRYNETMEIVPEQAENQIYVTLFIRTLWVSAGVTLLCLLLGYPVAYLLAQLPVRITNLLMILVLLPFWTSLLVRTTSWIALLQEYGVINDLLVWAGLVANDARLAMIYNSTGTLVAMTHILLPFMILPLYSVMKTISPTYTNAALSMGATPFTAFRRVYAPLTLPGVTAGSLLVFILALGYYITPALVGGSSGQLISNMIAFHMQNSLNWGLAAALGGILLFGVLALYFVYVRIAGVERMRFS
jgi:putative spermidine/putrescine transport system permease protein